MRTIVKTPAEIDAIRESGKILAAVLRVVARHVTPGISTKELADVAARELKALGGSAPFLGHEGFPDVICISIDDEIVHGIPSPKRILHDGDIVGLDFGVKYDGMITDSAISVGVGRIEPKYQRLLDVTKRSLDVGINVVHDKIHTGDIGSAIESYIRKSGSYGIPKELVGHGVGHQLWEEPNVPNYGKRGTGAMLEKGMTIAIEPMVTLGTSAISLADDGWTIRSADGSYAAHFEHTVLITHDGAEILTQ